MRSITLLLLALPAALSAQKKAPPKWLEIGKTSQGNPVFIDPKSVKREHGIVGATVRAVFATPVKTPKGELHASRTKAMFDCAKRQFAVKENWLYFDETKATVFEHRQPKVPGYGTVFKGTLPDVALTYLCRS